ncbi:hypothetical protein [Peribacillus sp. SCS-37]|uniref:hypothetical protein n=1 Tax=Paraperibacillus esterisolvens TaxID=3115296 RepID=UPI003905DF22
MTFSGNGTLVGTWYVEGNRGVNEIGETAIVMRIIPGWQKSIGINTKQGKPSSHRLP